MSASLSQLPDEVREVIQPYPITPASLESIGIEIAKKRDEAKAARESSNIENIWTAAEEAYEGIDNANRDEEGNTRWNKPLSSDGPVTAGGVQSGPQKSTAFQRITARYVDAASAKLQEILLPPDDKAFLFKEMPVPEVIEAAKDDSQVVHNGMPATRPLKPGEAPPPGVKPDAQGRVPMTVADVAKERIELMRKKAKAAETRIYDWMVASGFRREFRKVIKDAAKIGSGVLKGPVPKIKREAALKEDGDAADIIIKHKVIPSCSRISAWNFFPDPACGDDPHDGDFVFERDYMSARQVRGLKKIKGYIGTQIDKVLEEGPDKINVDNDGALRGQLSSAKKSRFSVWYFYGALTKDEMAAIDMAAGGETRTPDDVKEVYAIVTLINDSVVRATINPMDTGSFPYHVMPWQEREGCWAGIGVAEQMKVPQRILNAALRAMLNNAGKSSDNIYIFDQRALIPSDGGWEITPGKIFLTTNDAPEDVTKTFIAIQIPNTTPMLSSIIEIAERFAEESTSVPLISQGQSGKTTPDTFGGQQLQDNNANQLLRSIGASFDDYITEPVVIQYYELLLLDPDVPNEEKGTFQIEAHGSSALVERAIQDQTLGQLLGAAKDPNYGLNPKKTMGEFLRSRKLDPDAIQYTEDEQEKIESQGAPEAPQVTVAKINADTQIKLGVMKQQGDQQSDAAETQIEHAAQILEGERIKTDQHQIVVSAGVKMHAEELAHQRALLEYANRYRISLGQAKTQLADTSMKLQVEQELNAVNNALDLHKHHNPSPAPAVQVPGRAKNGQASSQVSG